MNTELLQSLAAWAGRTSLEALPLAVIAIVFWRMRGLPAAWRWWLPALFFLRLAMPQVPETSWQRWGLAAWTPPAAAELNVEGAVNSVAATEAPVSLPVLPILWALGGIAVAGWVMISQWRLRRCVTRHGTPATAELQQHAVWAAARMGLSKTVPLRVMPGWSTMAVHGWLRPELLVPEDLFERFSVAQIRGMFLHEMAHVRRRDVLWTWLALGLCALHWFNPLAWLALRRFHADRELACDAAALRALDPAARHDYGEALLLCLQGPALHSAPALAPFFRRFPELKQRLQNIMKPASPTLRSRIVTALLVPTLAAVTFTTARAQRDGEAPKPAPEGVPTEKPLREGEKPKGERENARDGEAGKTGPRDGEKPREGARNGEVKRSAAREGDGARMRKGEREGDGQRKSGPRDGDQPQKGPRVGDQPKSGARDGEARKSGPRDGEQPRKGARDGEGERKPGPRDGEGVKSGARDGDAPKAPREGDAAKPAREGDRAKPEGEKPAER